MTMSLRSGVSGQGSTPELVSVDMDISRDNSSLLTSPTEITNAPRRGAATPPPKAQSSSRKSPRGTISLEDEINWDYSVVDEREGFALYHQPDDDFAKRSKARVKDRSKNNNNCTDSNDSKCEVVTADDITEGCVAPVIKKTTDNTPPQILSCFDATAAIAMETSTKTYEFYKTQCLAEGEHRGDDADFFLNPASNPQAPKSPSKNGPRQAVLFDEDDERPDGSSKQQRKHKKNSKRSKRASETSMLDMEDEEGAVRVADTNEFEALEGTTFVSAGGEDPSSLRDYRLSLFQNDMEQKTVPQARLSRALQDLQDTDGAIDGIADELSVTKESLSQTKDMLHVSEKRARKQDKAVTDMRAKFVAERQGLHKRLQQEAEKTSHLQAKMSSVQMELNRVRNDLRKAKLSLQRKSKRYNEESRHEGESRDSGRSSVFSNDESATVLALRSEIASLKNQLEEARMFESRTVASSAEYNEQDVMRLVQHLEKAEVELRRLKESQSVNTSRDEALNDLQEQLVASEDFLFAATQREEILALELTDAKEMIASLRKSPTETGGGGAPELRGELHATKEAKARADRELEHLRVESANLRREIKRLSGALQDETQRARFEASERAKERMTMERKMAKQSKDTKSFKRAIQKLEEKLAKHEEFARADHAKRDKYTTRDLDFDPTLAAVSPVPMDESNFAVVQLEGELKKKAEEESALKSEVKTLTKKLREAKSISNRARDEAEAKKLEAEERAAAMERTVKDLQSKLEYREGELTKNDEVTQLKARAGTLHSETSLLKKRLVSAEAKVQQEMLRAEEERRMAIEADRERLDEIQMLRTELMSVKSVGDEKSRSSQFPRKYLPTPQVAAASPTSRDIPPKPDMNKLRSRIREAEGKSVILGHDTAVDKRSPLRTALVSPNGEDEEMFRLQEERRMAFEEAQGDVSSKCREESLADEIRSTEEGLHSAAASINDMEETLRRARQMINTHTPNSSFADGDQPSISTMSMSTMDVSQATMPLYQSMASPDISFAEKPPLSSPGDSPLKSSRDTSVAESPTPTRAMTPPCTPPRAKHRASPIRANSRALALALVPEEPESSAEARLGIKRLDVDTIQRRLTESNERLTAARDKLKDLVDGSPERASAGGGSGGSPSKHTLDWNKSEERLDPPREPPRTPITRSPARSLRDTNGYKSSSPKRTIQGEPPRTPVHDSARVGRGQYKTSPPPKSPAMGRYSNPTEQVLAKYRTYKSKRGISPSENSRNSVRSAEAMAAVVDAMVEDKSVDLVEGEI